MESFLSSDIELKKKLLLSLQIMFSKNYIRKLYKFLKKYSLDLSVDFEKRELIYIFKHNSELSQYFQSLNSSLVKKITSDKFPYKKIKRLNELDYALRTGRCFGKKFHYFNVISNTISVRFTNILENELIFNSQYEVYTFLNKMVFDKYNDFFYKGLLIKSLLGLPIGTEYEHVKKCIKNHDVSEPDRIVLIPQESKLTMFLNRDSNHDFVGYLKYLFESKKLKLNDFYLSKLKSELLKIKFDSDILKVNELLNRDLINETKLRKQVDFKDKYIELKEILKIK